MDRISTTSRLFLASKPNEVKPINIVDNTYEALCKLFSEHKITFEEFSKRSKNIAVESNASNERTLEEVV